MPSSLSPGTDMSTLLNLLKDGRFHSGQVLGEALGISRSAVWKQLQQLQRELNVPIHKVRGRGYQLADPLSLLDAEVIKSTVMPEWNVEILETIDSTNAYALRAIAQAQVAPLLVLAERQTAGRGRRGRPWVSPYGENLYYSLALRLDGGMRRLEGLSLVVGLAVLHALRDLGVTGARLKWPNDLLVGDQKLAGILLELVGDPGDAWQVVIGIGINVNMRSAPEVDRQWTSMRLQTGQLVDRNELVSNLSRSLGHYLERHADEGFDALREEWEQADAWRGRAVSLISGTSQVDGIALGIDAQGGLRLEVEGREQSFSGGELSLRLRCGE